MASERTPQQIIGDDAYTQLVFEGYVVTRPAPAATDTGLETVAQIDTGRKWRVHFLSHPVRGEELVTRSQAEELLAAKNAEIEQLKSDLETYQEPVIQDVYEKVDLEFKVADLEADNAALTARVKELEIERDEALDDAKFAERIATKREIDANASVEALEAKLAAAEKDMATVYAWLREPDWSNRNFNLVRWADRRPAPPSFAKAYDDRERAVLRGKPS